MYDREQDRLTDHPKGISTDAPQFAAGLRRQAREHARQLAGITLANGEYALMPPVAGDLALHPYKVCSCRCRCHLTHCGDDPAIKRQVSTHDGKAHYKSQAEMSPKGDTLSLYIYFGTVAHDAPTALIRDLDDSTMTHSIQRCTVGDSLLPA